MFRSKTAVRETVQIEGLQIERPVPFWDWNVFAMIPMFLAAVPFMLLLMASLFFGPVAFVVGIIGLLVAAPEFKQEWLWVTLGSFSAFVLAMSILFGGHKMIVVIRGQEHECELCALLEEIEDEVGRSSGLRSSR